jgi:hypothetical protein
MPKPYTLSCHCGNIRFEVDAELEKLCECNCSTCRRFGMISWYVPIKAVRLLTEKLRLSRYVWHHLSGGWEFCPICGTTIAFTGYPGGIVNVNARCIEDVDVFELNVERVDGRKLIPPGPLP